VDASNRLDWNTYNFDPTSEAHQDTVFRVCQYLYNNGYPFLTRPKFKSGYLPDVLCPTFHTPIIEVRESENDRRTIAKFEHIPKELIEKIIYVDANVEFSEEMIL